MMSKWWAYSVLLLFLLSFVTSSKEEAQQQEVQQHQQHHNIPRDSLQPPDVAPTAANPSRVPPASMSLTLSPGGAVTDTGFIRIFNPPEVVADGYRLEVQYQCIGKKRVGVQLNVWTDRKPNAVSVFSRMWNCTQHSPNQYERKDIILHVPRALAYRPSPWNPVTVTSQDAVLRAWVMDPDVFIPPRWSDYNFRFATANVQYAARILNPYDRPEAPSTHCYTWWKLLQLKKTFSPMCPLEPEVVTLIKYPVALSGTSHGVIRTLPNFKTKELEEERKERLPSPRWTLVMYVYIVEYCASNRALCSIFQRLKWDDLYMTPLIYVNQLGQLHLQLVCENAEPIAHLTSFSLPKGQWLRIVVTMENSRWFVTVNYGQNWEKKYDTLIRVVTRSPVWYDSEPALHILGGSEITPSFKGYVGHAKIYRRVVKEPKNIPFPAPDDPMFGLGIGEKAKRCSDLLNWITYRIKLYRYRVTQLTSHNRCPAGFLALFPGYKPPAIPARCDKQAVRRSAAYRFTRRWVRRQAYAGWQFTLSDVGTAIYAHAVEVFEDSGFEHMSEVVQLLKQSSCYGNHDASYFLASILNHGVGVKSDEIMAHHYLMSAAIDNHRLSLLGLGNKHVYGLDGMPVDLEQAYVYYKNMGDQSRTDREAHEENDVYTEQVRLTDDYTISEQTEEDGDLFLWFQHQAAQGVVRAQRDLARIMFWGSQGVKRNIKAAVEFYRISAESGEPSALFDYGIVLLKGQGVPQNYTGALHYLGEAAKKGHAGAMNALGWYALEISQNYTEARDLFMKAHNIGNADATHNIGHMYLGGRHPDSQGVDRINAFKFFSDAAMKGQYDSSIMVAMYNMRGHPNASRDPDIAVAWARYVSETNPALGRVLAKGLKAYRHKNWPAAIMYYMLAADAGVEVGNFNLAMLCEENNEGVTSFIEKECVWRFYRLATKREPQFVDSYSWIKMGDYHWYGCEKKRDPLQAAIMYANGALKGDPHAIFNLAYLVEEGIYIPTYIWRGLKVSESVQATNVTLLRELYYRCKESVNTEAYLPCTLALLRVEALDMWQRHHVLVKFSTMVGFVVAAMFTFTSAYTYLRDRRLHVSDV